MKRGGKYKVKEREKIQKWMRGKRNEQKGNKRVGKKSEWEEEK